MGAGLEKGLVTCAVSLVGAGLFSPRFGGTRSRHLWSVLWSSLGGVCPGWRESVALGARALHSGLRGGTFPDKPYQAGAWQVTSVCVVWRWYIESVVVTMVSRQVGTDQVGFCWRCTLAADFADKTQAKLCLQQVIVSERWRAGLSQGSHRAGCREARGQAVFCNRQWRLVAGVLS